MYWIAVCDEHKELDYDEREDAYGPLASEARPLCCDHSGCSEKAEWEILKEVAEALESPGIHSRTTENGEWIRVLPSFLEERNEEEDSS